MGVGWELRHIRTNFGENRRNGLQQGVLLLELFRGEPGSDLDVQGFDLFNEKIEMAECVPQQKSMMVGETIPL